ACPALSAFPAQKPGRGPDRTTYSPHKAISSCFISGVFPPPTPRSLIGVKKQFATLCFIAKGIRIVNVYKALQVIGR
ncbi:hypothetical protein ACT9UI_19130, partial [Acinetobacter baumannii]|uniref:hypothetical protein n=1 Tax=Acinetobacter baumannii TaxID=470 RepID=UPI0040390EF6